MKFRRTFHVECRCQIDGKSMKMCPLGFQIGTTSHTKLFSIFWTSTVDSCYLEHALSRISRNLELFSWSLQHLESTSLWNVSLSRIPLSWIIRHLELIFWSLGRITVAISNFSENVAHRNQSMKFFSFVFERVCLIEYYFNRFSIFFFS